MDKQLKDLWGDGLAEQVEQAYSAEQALPGPALLKQRIMYTPQREVQGRKRVFKPQLSRPQWVAGGVILILVGIFTNYNDPGSSRFTPQEVAVLEAVFADVGVSILAIINSLRMLK